MNFPKEIPKFAFTRPDPNIHVNRTPCSLETSLLQQLVLSRRRYLTAIDDEISATISMSEELKKEIEEMEARMDEKRSMLTLLNKAVAASQENRNKVLKDIMSLSNVIPVVRRLPDEILVCIFVHAVETEEEERRRLALEWRSYSLGKVPLTISAVCRRWRYMAMGMPALWRFINVVSEDEDATVTPPSLAKWCSLGDPDKREISIDGWRMLHHSPLPVILKATTTRKRSVLPRIEVSCIDGLTEFNADWPFIYPLAREAVLISNGAHGICDYFVPLVTRAEKLVLSGIKPWWSDAIWDSLVDLTLVGMPNTRLPSLRENEIVEMMTMVPGLRKLDIEWDSSRTVAAEVRPGPPTVVHGELKSLCSSFESIETYIAPFQGAVVCPSLESLRLKSLPFITPSMMRGWTAFFNTVTPFPLQKLTLPGIQSDSVDHLLQLFRLLPYISHLYLTGPAVEQLLDHLVVDTESTAIIPLPCLEVLDIRDAYITGQTLLNCVSSRCTSAATARGVSRVKTVCLYETPSVSPGLWEALQLHMFV